MGKKTSPYPSNAELREMSGAELNDCIDSISARGLDDGPEWDRVYKTVEKLGSVF